MGWPYHKIGDLCDLATGGTPSKRNPEFFEGGQIPWLVSGDIHRRIIDECDGRITEAGLQNSSAKFLPENSVMIALNGQGKTRGTVALLKMKATCNQSLVAITPKDPSQLLPEYLFAYLHGKYEEIRKITGDSGNDRRGLNMPLIRKIEIPIAPLDEQKRIVAILDQAFEGIDKAIANTEQNFKNARELFESFMNSIFLKGGPDWKEATLGEVCKFQGGSQPPKADFSSVQQEGYVRLIQIRDYKSEDKKVFIPKEKAKRSCTKDDVMIGRYGPPLFQILRGLEGSYNVALIKATPTHPWLTKEFLFYFLRNRNILNYIIAASSRAAGQIGLNKKTIEPYPISFPAPDEQSIIVKKIADVEAQTQNLEALYRLKLSALKDLKQSLLQKAFSGELTTATAQEAAKVA